MKRLLVATALVYALAGMAQAQTLTVAAANVSNYLDPARDHSNVGSQFYINSFDPLIHRDYSTTENDPPSVNANSRPKNPWDRAAGLDPNARSIERNLGYQ